MKFMYKDVLANNCSCIICTSVIHGGRMPVLHRYMDVTILGSLIDIRSARHLDFLSITCRSHCRGAKTGKAGSRCDTLSTSLKTYWGLLRLCKKPSIGRIAGGKPLRVWLFYWVPACETVQKTSLGYAGGKPNPLNPPYQGDFPLNSPLIKGAREVKNDERWVSCTVSTASLPIQPPLDRVY